jgi:hypothetical protein
MLMYEVLTNQTPYYDIEMSSREIVDNIGHRSIPLVGKTKV